ncbi:hypothetical protein HY478_03080 [Candidatus Uhrbacteria bacterium]|nr:hypothetical protein [Candidatus Uhrbacteria bacterium]
MRAECDNYEKEWKIPSTITLESASLPEVIVNIAEKQAKQLVHLKTLVDNRAKKGQVYYVYAPAMTGKSAVVRLFKEKPGTCLLDLVNFGTPTLSFAQGFDELRDVNIMTLKNTVDHLSGCRSIVVDSFDEVHPTSGERVVNLLKTIVAPAGNSRQSTVVIFGRAEGYRQAQRIFAGIPLVAFPRYQFADNKAIDYILQDYVRFERTFNVKANVSILRNALKRVLDAPNGWKVRCLFQAADAANKLFEELESRPTATPDELLDRVYDSILQRAQKTHRRPPNTDQEAQARAYREYLCQLARLDVDDHGNIDLPSDTALRSWTLGRSNSAEAMASYSGLVEIDPLPHDRIAIAFLPRVARLKAAKGCAEPTYWSQFATLGEHFARDLPLKVLSGR